MVYQRKDNPEPISVYADERIHPNINMESLAKLRLAFKKKATVATGNASNLGDGAAMVVTSDTEVAHFGCRSWQ